MTMIKMAEKIRILNIDIHNHKFSGFLEALEQGVVVTPNIDHLMKLQNDREFYDAYLQAEHVVCDSRLVQLSSMFLFPGRGIVERISGSDLLPEFCKHHKSNLHEIRVFLLGGTEESVQLARNNLNLKSASEIVVAGYSPPFGFEHDKDECDRIIQRINESGATALAVGVGAPKQELWIQQYRQRLPGIKVFLAVGAAINFAAGTLQRAPHWMNKFGLEWLYRMFQEPRLIKRYVIDDLPFFWLLLKQKFGFYSNPWNDSK